MKHSRSVAKSEVLRILRMVNPKFKLTRRIDPRVHENVWVVTDGDQEVVRRKTLALIHSWARGNEAGVRSKMEEMLKRKGVAAIDQAENASLETDIKS